MRLQKYMAMCGVASRRASEEIILKGRVQVNGEIIDYMGFEVDEDNDVVEVDGVVIKPETKKYYILLNKPKGYVTTVSDEFDRPTVMELVRDVHARIYPVGRLDYDTYSRTRPILLIRAISLSLTQCQTRKVLTP